MLKIVFSQFDKSTDVADTSQVYIFIRSFIKDSIEKKKKEISKNTTPKIKNEQRHLQSL